MSKNCYSIHFSLYPIPRRFLYFINSIFSPHSWYVLGNILILYVSPIDITFLLLEYYSKISVVLNHFMLLKVKRVCIYYLGYWGLTETDRIWWLHWFLSPWWAILTYEIKKILDSNSSHIGQNHPLTNLVKNELPKLKHFDWVIAKLVLI